MLLRLFFSRINIFYLATGNEAICAIGFSNSDFRGKHLRSTWKGSVCKGSSLFRRPTIIIMLLLLLLQEARATALSQSLNGVEVERELRSKIEHTERRTADVKNKLANISNDEHDLEKKIERRQREYDQLQKRLAKLQVDFFNRNSFSTQTHLFSLFDLRSWTSTNSSRVV